MGTKPVLERSVNARLPTVADSPRGGRHVRRQSDGGRHLGRGFHAAHWAACPTRRDLLWRVLGGCITTLRLINRAQQSRFELSHFGVDEGLEGFGGRFMQGHQNAPSILIKMQVAGCQIWLWHTPVIKPLRRWPSV